MRKVVISVVATTLVVGFAGPASANNDVSVRQDSFPASSDISSTLGTYSEAPEVSAEKFTERWYVCADLQAKAATELATAVYATSPASQSGVRADARIYGSPKAAKTAFTKIKAGLDMCTGSGVEESEPGSSMKWVVTTSVGRVPSVQGDGGGSLFVYQQEKPAKGSSAKQNQLGTSYSVLTLVGNSILVSDANVIGAARMSTAQRAAVASFASDFAKTWSAGNE